MGPRVLFITGRWSGIGSNTHASGIPTFKAMMKSEQHFQVPIKTRAVSFIPFHFSEYYLSLIPEQKISTGKYDRASLIDFKAALLCATVENLIICGYLKIYHAQIQKQFLGFQYSKEQFTLCSKPVTAASFSYLEQHIFACLEPGHATRLSKFIDRLVACTLDVLPQMVAHAQTHFIQARKVQHTFSSSIYLSFKWDDEKIALAKTVEEIKNEYYTNLFFRDFGKALFKGILEHLNRHYFSE